MTKDNQERRRDFFKQLALAGVAAQIGFFSSCSSKENWPSPPADWLTSKETFLILKFQNILFPDDGNGPSCNDFKAFEYFLWKYSDGDEVSTKREKLKSELQNSEKIIQKYYVQDLREIDSKDWFSLVELLSMKKETSKMMSRILSYVLEALATDPIYGGNTNEIGWEWLEHQPGMPRPSNTNKHPLYYQKS